MKPVSPLSPIYEVSSEFEFEGTSDNPVYRLFYKYSIPMDITMSHLSPLDCHNVTVAIGGIKNEDGRVCRQFYTSLLESVGAKVERGENAKVKAYEVSHKIESQIKALVYDFGRGYTAEGCDMQEKILPCIWVDKTTEKSYKEIALIKKCTHTLYYCDDFSLNDIFSRCRAKPATYPDVIKLIEKVCQLRRQNRIYWE